MLYLANATANYYLHLQFAIVEFFVSENKLSKQVIRDNNDAVVSK